MGEVEIDTASRRFNVFSHIVLYGDAANEELARIMRDEIEGLWNDPGGYVFFKEQHFQPRFIITAEARPGIDQLEVISNTNPRNNYFRIEEFIHGNISFVDGLGCNTGYFLVENLYAGSTTAAHEYGHTIGLDHPKYLDILG